MGVSEDSAGTHTSCDIGTVSMGEHSIVDHDRGAVEKISHLEIIITLRDLGKGDIRGID
jgi:hypothetical protein